MVYALTQFSCKGIGSQRHSIKEQKLNIFVYLLELTFWDELPLHLTSKYQKICNNGLFKSENIEIRVI